MRLIAVSFVLYGVWTILWAGATTIPFFFGPADLVALYDERVPTIVQYVLPPARVVLASYAMLAGVGLLQRAEWGRPTATLMALVSLLFIPLGTVFGAIALWVLSRAARSEAVTSAPAPAASA